MRPSSAWKWPALAAAGVLVAAGALLICKAEPGSCPGIPSGKETTPILSPGETNMSIAQTKPQVHHADEANFDNLVLNAEVPVLVDFYADWCGPCKRLAPLLEELAAETPHARIVKVNVDHNPNLAAAYRINSIPTLKVFRNGAVTDQLVGLASKSQLREMLVP